VSALAIVLLRVQVAKTVFEDELMLPGEDAFFPQTKFPPKDELRREDAF